MKKILLSTLALTMLAVNSVQPMDKPEAPKSQNTLLKTAKNTLSEIGDITFNFMYKHPFITAFAIAPLVPNIIAPFRMLTAGFVVAAEAEEEVALIATVLALPIYTAGIAIRANLLHMFSHNYLKEKNIEHKDNAFKSYLLLSKCKTCNPKIEKTK